MLSNWKIYLYFASCIGLFILGFVTAWSWQGERLNVCREQQKVCVSANVENQKTISNLQGELAKSNKSCEARLKSKDKALRELKEIDELKGGTNVPKGGTGEKGNSNPTGDAILDALNRMW